MVNRKAKSVVVELCVGEKLATKSPSHEESQRFPFEPSSLVVDNSIREATLYYTTTLQLVSFTV